MSIVPSSSYPLMGGGKGASGRLSLVFEATNEGLCGREGKTSEVVLQSLYVPLHVLALHAQEHTNILLFASFI